MCGARRMRELMRHLVLLLPKLNALKVCGLVALAGLSIHALLAASLGARQN